MSSKLNKSAKAYGAIVSSYIQGFVKTNCARIAQLSLEVSIMQLRSGPLPPREEWPEDWADLIASVSGVTVDEFDSFRYVGNFGQLVFATTLLDTFLTDTTRFILLLFPESVGKAQGITVNDIIGASSTTALLEAAIEKRVRDISYRAFLERVDYLRDQHGLSVELPDWIRKDLEHFSGIRNVMIHDQAFYNLRLEDDGSVAIKSYSCPVHPKPVSGEQIKGAVRAYMGVVAHVASAVFKDILKVRIPDSLIKTWREDGLLAN